MSPDRLTPSARSAHPDRPAGTAVPSASASSASGPSAPVPPTGLSPQRLYRVLAFAEAVTWTLLIAGMIGKYLLRLGDLGVRIGGGIHGFVFLTYCAVTVLIGVDARWGAGRTLLGLGSAVIPYATIPFELSTQHHGLLPHRWRLRSDEPTGPLERLVAFAQRHPILAVLIAAVVLPVVFSLLLMAGPPTEWFS